MDAPRRPRWPPLSAGQHELPSRPGERHRPRTGTGIVTPDAGLSTPTTTSRRHRLRSRHHQGRLADRGRRWQDWSAPRYRTGAGGLGRDCWRARSDSSGSMPAAGRFGASAARRAQGPPSCSATAGLDTGQGRIILALLALPPFFFLAHRGERALAFRAYQEPDVQVRGPRTTRASETDASPGAEGGAGTDCPSRSSENNRGPSE